MTYRSQTKKRRLPMKTLRLALVALVAAIVVTPVYAGDYNGGPGPYAADRQLDSLGRNGKLMHSIRSPSQLSRTNRRCGHEVVVRGVVGWAVSQNCLAGLGRR
jgi:hypothetical protein